MRVAIIGAAGCVGSSVAFACALSGDAEELLLCDVREALAESYALDMEPLATLTNSPKITLCELTDIVAADIVVVTAAAQHRPGQRADQLIESGLLLGSVLDSVMPNNPNCIIIMVTNPVNALTSWAGARWSLDRRRILGYVANDTARLRLAARANPINRLDGIWAMGDHAGVLVGVDVSSESAHASLAGDCNRILQEWYSHWQTLKSGRTPGFLTGYGVARMISAIATGSNEVWPAAAILEGEYDIRDVAITVPCVLGPEGLSEVLTVPLSPDQAISLQASAEGVRSAARRLAAYTHGQFSADQL